MKCLEICSMLRRTGAFNVVLTNVNENINRLMYQWAF